MDFRLANEDDLPQLKSVYKKIIHHMNKQNICIWDNIYPCDFFYEDIMNNRLYILEENHTIISAFALCESNPGEYSITWENRQDKALYLDRFAVNVNYLGKGFGSVMFEKAVTLVREKGAEYLRLFVVDINAPAINLYIKNGFKKADGSFDEIVHDGFVLHELGFEKKISM